MYSEYIFRMPYGTPDLDYGSLAEYLVRRAGVTSTRELRNFSSYAEIGTTVRIRWIGPGRDESAALPPAIGFWLYGTLIARIMPGDVYFPRTDDTHQATTYWLAQIIADNAIGTNAGRIRRHKADGPGPMGPRGHAGLLVIDWDRSKPVEGHSYQTGDVAALHARRARWAEEVRKVNAELAERTMAETRQFYADLAERAAAEDGMLAAGWQPVPGCELARETLRQHGQLHVLDELLARKN